MIIFDIWMAQHLELNDKKWADALDYTCFLKGVETYCKMQACSETG